MGRYRTMKDVTPTRYENHGYAARFVEDPFEDGALVVEFRYRFGQNCYDMVVRIREDAEPFHREVELCRFDNFLPAGVTRERMAEAADDVANAEA